ncbi:MAG: BolA family transcriptional regulator [Alphaproteobacteria bacterium GM202ARS2]|nr:BolA family transcriptional regulator [Alphaproteobacteria bacterium GM202ARS2]
MNKKAWIEEQLRKAFSPTHLVVRDDSDAHRHHQAMIGRPAQETHFHVEVVSESFRGMGRVERQRAIYRVLAAGMGKGGIHALELATHTPEERAGDED